MPGTTGYCDDQAAAVIRRRIKDCSAEALHFIDNGNYHYLSYFWLEKLKQPVDLLVFDHHSDMLRPVFGELMSCGSWLLRTVQELPNVQRVMIFGIDPDYVSHVPKPLRPGGHGGYGRRVPRVSGDTLRRIPLYFAG